MALALELLLGSVWDLFASVLGLLLFLGTAALQAIWLWSTEETGEKSRWTLLILAGALSLVSPLLFLSGRELAIALIGAGVFPYAVVLFSGALAGTILYKLWTKVHAS